MICPIFYSERFMVEGYKVFGTICTLIHQNVLYVKVLEVRIGEKTCAADL